VRWMAGKGSVHTAQGVQSEIRDSPGARLQGAVSD
jgi:hypothetical protein